MLNISSVNCSPIKPNFGRKEIDESKKRINKQEFLDDVTHAASILKNDKLDDERKSRELQNIGEKLAENLDPASPLKVVVTTAGFCGAGFFLGRKMVGKKVLGIIDKNTKVIDFLSKQTGIFMEKLKKIPVSEEKTVKAFFTRIAGKVSEFLEKSASKGVTAKKGAEMTAVKSKNLTKKIISNLGGSVGAISGITAVTKDEDNNGKSDLLEKTSELSTIGKISKAVDTIGTVVDLAS